MEKITFRFTNDATRFENFVKLRYRSYPQKGILITLPILCFKGISHRKDPIFNSSFSFILESLEELDSLKEIKSWECEKFFKDKPYNPLIQLEKHAKKWISEDKPEPIPIIDTDYICGTEFIQVDDESSFYGNFEQNGMEGCHMCFEGRGEYEDYTEFKSLTCRPYISNYVQGNRQIETYEKTDEEIVNQLLEFGLGTAVNHFKKSLLEYNIKENIDSTYAPYWIHLAGNDDDSWSKYFYSEEDMMNEVYRLRRCQPINKQIDVIDNGYYFTN